MLGSSFRNALGKAAQLHLLFGDSPGLVCGNHASWEEERRCKGKSGVGSGKGGDRDGIQMDRNLNRGV